MPSIFDPRAKRFIFFLRRTGHSEVAAGRITFAPSDRSLRRSRNLLRRKVRPYGAVSLSFRAFLGLGMNSSLWLSNLVYSRLVPDSFRIRDTSQAPVGAWLCQEPLDAWSEVALRPLTWLLSGLS